MLCAGGVPDAGNRSGRVSELEINRYVWSRGSESGSRAVMVGLEK